MSNVFAPDRWFQLLTVILTMMLHQLMSIIVSQLLFLWCQSRWVQTRWQELVQTFVPNDVVNLLIGLPVLLGSMWQAWRGKWMGPLLWMGALFFVFYNYTAYVFAMSLNWAFFACIFLMELSAYALIALVAMVDGKAIQEKLTGAVHEKFPGGVLAGLGLLFILRVIGVWMNAINIGERLRKRKWLSTSRIF